MFQQSRRLAWMFLCIASLLLFSTLPALAQVSPSIDRTSGGDAAAPQQDATSAQALPIQPVQRLRVLPVRDPNAAAVGFAAPAGAHLSYFGGPVISNVHVVQVLYGSGSYNAQVAGTTSPTMGNFYGDLTGPSSGYSRDPVQHPLPAARKTIGNGTLTGCSRLFRSRQQRLDH
jgi:hypothetical protein